MAEATVTATREKLRLLGVTAEQVAELERTGKPSDHVTIYAPVGGIVTRKDALEGMYVSTGTPIYTIADLSRVWVKLDAYESDLMWLRYGQTVEFTTVSYPGEVFRGRIAFIDPVLDARTRTAKVRLDVPNDDGRLKPEMFVKAVVRAHVAAGGKVMDVDLAGRWICPMHPSVIKPAPGTCDICGMPLVTTESLGYVSADTAAAEAPLVIPASAALTTGQRAIVYVELPGTDQPTFQGYEVLLGPRAGDYYLVRSGLKEGERVVTRGNFKIDSALQIQARPSMMSPQTQPAAGAQPASGPATSSAAAQPIDPEFAAQLSAVVDAYLAAAQALARDDVAGAVAAAGSARQGLSAVDMKLLSAQEHQAWMPLADQLDKALVALSGAADIESARKTFASLSDVMIAVAGRYGAVGGALVRLHCPMAFNGRGADWLQRDTQVRNPYFGSAMPTCGTVVGSLPAAAGRDEGAAMNDWYRQPTAEQRSPVGRLIGFCLTNKLVVVLLVAFVVLWGLRVAPFDWNLGPLPRAPVPTDAIPDIGENQQIVFTDWPGRSPQDVEDQITRNLSRALAGVPHVKTIRSTSMFGFATIFVIFDEGVDFYWARSRLLEKLNSLPEGTLPEGVRAMLGPDATALGQIFWYTLEGRDPDGHPAGGWDLEELRTIQDWDVRYALLAAPGVSEVASGGGFVREYQVDVDADAMRAYGVTLMDVFQAVRGSNIDVGAGTIEVNRVEYTIRGVGFVKSPADIEDSVVTVRENVPVRVAQVARVTLGPAPRRRALDRDGAEAVGGVVVARFGSNPLAVIQNVKAKIAEIAPSLPTKVVIDHAQVSDEQVRRFAADHGFSATAGAGRLDHPAWLAFLRSIPRGQWPAWITTSHVTIVPAYDRTGLIYETLGTLNDAIGQEILITAIVVVLMIANLRSSVLIGGMMPLAVLLCFIAMKTFGVDANIVALSGIAIAIGTIVDMGIVLCENVLRRLGEAPPDAPKLEVVHRAASEVGSAVLTAVATTVVGFLPVFAMTGPEGKLFRPLAFTKTFALIASIVIALTVIPPLAHAMFCWRISSRRVRGGVYVLLAVAVVALAGWGLWQGSGLVVASAVAAGAFVAYGWLRRRVPQRLCTFAPVLANAAVVLLMGLLLSGAWEPLGPQRGPVRNFLFVAMLVGGIMALFGLFQHFYRQILTWCLEHKVTFLAIPAAVTVLGAFIWLGFPTMMGWLPAAAEKVGLDPQIVRTTTFWVGGSHALPGLGREFMPPLDEGSYLWMPTTMAHASIGEALDIVSRQDRAFAEIPEVESILGKLGRMDSALDPAPISMIETIVNYRSEYVTDASGRRVNFRYDPEGVELAKDADGRLVTVPDGANYYVRGRFARDVAGRLIPDLAGRPFRQWRPPLEVQLNEGRTPWAGIRSPDDIWTEIVQAGRIPGTTSAPKLQPIAARIVMLQSGMRASMGIKIHGGNLETIERFGLELERLLRELPAVEPATVAADRIVGKPYVEIVPDREAMDRYGVKMRDFQDVVEIAIGGVPVTTSVEENQRFVIRVRYERESATVSRPSRACSYPGPRVSRSPSSRSPRSATSAGRRKSRAKTPS